MLKGYWKVPVAIILTMCFFLLLDECGSYWKDHWGVPVVEVPKIPVVEMLGIPAEDSIVECSYNDIQNNGYEFRIEICGVTKGVTTAWLVDGVVVKKVLHLTPVMMDYDVDFWLIYDARAGKRQPDKIRKRHSDDI